MQNIKIHKLIGLLLFFQYSFGCDICGCGATNASGLQGDFLRNYIGIRYNYADFGYKQSLFNSHLAHDYIHSTQIQGQVYLVPKMGLNFTVPYQNNHRVTDTQSVTKNGLGDVSFYGFYNLLKSTSNHSFRIGTGLKLPTGKFNLTTANSAKISANQLGTGSLDVLVPIQYAYYNQKFGFSIGAVQYIKGENTYHYQFGDQTQISGKVNVRVFKNDRSQVQLNTGLSYDEFKPISYHGITDDSSDGFLTMASLGGEYHYDQLAFGITYNLPTAQNLAEQEITFQNGLSFHTYWKF